MSSRADVLQRSPATAVAFGPLYLVGIAMPAAWTTAVMTFQTSRDGSTFLEVQDGAGNALTLTVAASQYILIDPARFRGTNLLKVRSGTAAAPVNQPAQAVIGLVVRPIV